MIKRRRAKKEKFISLLAVFGDLFGTLKNMVGEITDIAALEFQITKRSIILIFWLTISVSFLLISAWTLILATLGSAIVELLHWRWVAAFGLLAIFNVLVIICLLFWINRARKRLGFPITRSQLNFFKREEP